MIPGRPPADRRALLQDAEREIARIVEDGKRLLAAYCAQRGGIRFLIGPSRAEVHRAAQSGTPGQSAIMIAAATLRTVHARVTPGDAPACYALGDACAAVWERGRIIQRGTPAGAAARRTASGILIAGGGILGTIQIPTDDIADGSGRPRTAADVMRWLQAGIPS